ncbi:MAG: nuclear transport factor 2 family protein [Saprospiraceae bacterium]|nr:nuclear transport factor 2 family protein [Saprospiraceae bacterium]
MTKKEISIQFLKYSASGQSRIAFELFVSQQFKHHNPFFKADPDSLIVAMEENAKLFPEKRIEILRALEDENLVSIHSYVKLFPTHVGIALIHIFRFEENKIVELWDFGQAVPEDMINENGMF